PGRLRRPRPAARRRTQAPARRSAAPAEDDQAGPRTRRTAHSARPSRHAYSARTSWRRRTRQRRAAGVVIVNSLGEAPTDWRGCFADAAAWFVELTSAARPHLAQPALGEWTVRDLVGHTSRSLTTVVDYLGAAGPIDLDAAADYFRAAADVDPANVAEHGR